MGGGRGTGDGGPGMGDGGFRIGKGGGGFGMGGGRWVSNGELGMGQGVKSSSPNKRGHILLPPQKSASYRMRSFI